MSTTIEDAAKAIVAEFKEQPGTVSLAVKHYILTKLVEQILEAGESAEGISISATSTLLSDTADDDGSATHVVHHDFYVGSFHFGWTTTETVSGVSLGQWQ